MANEDVDLLLTKIWTAVNIVPSELSNPYE